ncbi:uncharacterized protein [Eurosta solidaginis]
MEEDDDYELGEEKSIVLRVPKPAAPPKVISSAASIEARLREMQRKLSEIAEIPKILSSTLATVSQTFEILKSTDLPQQKQQDLLQYQQHRKHSYDEDVLDYELSGATETDECLKLKAKVGAKGAKVGKGKVQTKTASTVSKAKKSQLAKEMTPESDYASEGNSEINEANTNDDYADGDGSGGINKRSDVNNNRRNMKEMGDTSGDGSMKNYNKNYNYTLRNMALTGINTSDDDDDDDDDEGEQQYSYITRIRPSKSSQQKQPKTQNDDDAENTSATEDEDNDYGDDDNDGKHNNDSEGETFTVRFVATDCGSDDETDDNDEENDDDEDFLTTTYTWSLRKIPKLQLNDDSQSFDKNNAAKNLADADDTDEENPNKKARWCHGYDDTQDDDNQATAQWTEEEGAKDKKFYEKSEHFWPWADREKIIYKQSTCHLVRRRPLGLVEQRIKLLAKQNLADSLEKQLHTK